MKYGLSKSQLNEINEFISRYAEIDEAVLFGSRAIDTYKEASDVDLAIKGSNATASLAAKLKEQFEEESYLPFFFDIVAYQSISSEELIQHINDKGIAIYRRGMGEWKEKTLSDLAILYNDSWKVGDEECAYIALEHIEEGKLRLNGIDYSNIVASNKYRFNEKNFLFGKLRPYFRKVVRPQFSGICSTDIWVVGALGETDLIFLFYLFANQEFVDLAYSGSSGTRMPRADWKFMKDTIWIIPADIEEQKAIASVLSCLDDKIDLLHRQNKTLEAMAETLFRQWFVEEAQENWEEGELNYFAENPRNTVKPMDIISDTRYIGLEHIDRRNIALIQSGNSSDVTSNKYRFIENDILFGKLRPYFHKVCFTPFEGICSTDILVIRPKEPHYFAYCLFAFFQNDVVEYANLGSEGTRMPRTNWEILGQYMVRIPDEEILKKFNRLIAPSIEKIKHNQKQISTLEKLRDTLLPKLMSGEVRVEYEE